MAFTGEFLQTTFEKLAPLDEKEPHHTWLVKSKNVNGLFVEKEVSPEVFYLSLLRKEISNPHLSTIRYTYQNTDRYYVIEEYIAGITLQQMLEEKIPFSEEDAIHYILQILDGLSAIHPLKIVHRDIKPSNIMLSNDNVIKIIDFGIARTWQETRSKDTSFLGTEGYAAPEQFGFRQSDERADIYAVGVLLNCLLTKCITGQKSSCDKRIKAIIDKATSLDPDDRYPDAAALERALRDVQTGHNSWIPGFRSNILWRKILAGIIYGICLFFFSLYFFDAVLITRQNVFRELLSAFLVFLVSPLCYGNVFYWDQIFTFLRFPRWLRIFLRIVFATFIFVIGMELYVGVPPQSIE